MGLGEVEPGVPLRDPVVEEDEGGQGLEAVRRSLIWVLYLDDRYLSAYRSFHTVVWSDERDKKKEF